MRMMHYSVSGTGILGEKIPVLLSGVEPKEKFVCQRKQKRKKKEENNCLVVVNTPVH